MCSSAVLSCDLFSEKFPNVHISFSASQKLHNHLEIECIVYANTNPVCNVHSLQDTLLTQKQSLIFFLLLIHFRLDGVSLWQYFKKDFSLHFIDKRFMHMGNCKLFIVKKKYNFIIQVLLLYQAKPIIFNHRYWTWNLFQIIFFLFGSSLMVKFVSFTFSP